MKLKFSIAALAVATCFSAHADNKTLWSKDKFNAYQAQNAVYDKCINDSINALDDKESSAKVVTIKVMSACEAEYKKAEEIAEFSNLDKKKNRAATEKSIELTVMHSRKSSK